MYTYLLLQLAAESLQGFCSGRVGDWNGMITVFPTKETTKFNQQTNHTYMYLHVLYVQINNMCEL